MLAPCPVAQWARQTPGQLALVGPGARWTCRELEARVAAEAGRLAAGGVRAGERVALLSGNRPELGVQLLALARLRAIAVLLNARLTAAELAPQLALAEPRTILADPGLRPLVEFSGLLFQEPPEFAPIEGSGLDPEAPFAILFTSGTTGRAKAAVLTWGNFAASARASAANLGGDPGQRWLATLPLFHVGGLSMVIRCALYGATLVLHERFDPQALNEAVDREGITHLSLVATTLARMLEARGERPFPDSLRAVLVGGGPTPTALLAQARRLGAPVLHTYGLTEACSQVTTERPGEADGLTCGPPLQGTQVRIVDAQGAALPAGEVGEIEVRGPTVMRGYFRNEEATREALEDGWLRTRDLGALDERSRLRVFARRTDLILSGGENVYPAEVEAVLLGHPAVAEAAVVGQPDPVWGQTPVAALVARAQVADAELERFCRERLAGFKVPRRFVRVEALPRNAGGKVDRKALLELFALRG